MVHYILYNKLRISLAREKEIATIMNTRINYGKNSGRPVNAQRVPYKPSGGAGARVATEAAEVLNATQNGTEEGGCRKCRPCCGKRRAEFCETITLHESFDASDICPSSVRICYDTNFLGYTLEELSMEAKLPCGGSCPIDVYRVSLTGAIPYLVSTGPVTSGCGDGVCLSCQGTCMVDEMIGYLCGDEEPDLATLDCMSVTPTVNVSTEKCGCSNQTNVTFHGVFTFTNLPEALS